VKKAWTVLAGVVAVALLTLGGAWVWQMSLVPTLETSGLGAADAASAPVVPASGAAAEPLMRYPIEPAGDAPAAAVAGDPASIVGELLTSTALLGLFEWRDFARRVAATVDNLGRSHAPSALWPVHPVSGRFKVDVLGETATISADNSARYTPYVVLLEQLEPARAYGAYVRLYPQIQHAYEELGFPNRYFNDRLVEVIDQLLATVQVDAPPAVHLPQVHGPYALERPWVLYEFDDPAWAALSCGQRILLRIGPDNERRVKRRLAQWRELLTRRGAPPATGAVVPAPVPAVAPPR